MKALFLEGSLSLREDLQLPVRQENESLIRVEMAGICETDLKLLGGYASFTGIPGHEFVGVVVETDEHHLKGRRVVGEINIACEDCDLCARRLPSHCVARKAIGIRGQNGAFAEFIVLPNSNLHVVPDNIPSPCAVFAEPLAAACRILEQVEITARESVAVIGDGKLGLLIAQVIATRTDEIVLVGKHRHKLAILERRNITTTLRHDFTSSGFDVVVDASGSPDGLLAALRAVRPNGTIVVKSTFASPIHLDMADIVVREISVIGSRCGPFSPALKLLKKEAVDVDSLISAVYPLSRWQEAFEAAARPESLKILLRPE